MSSAGDAGSTGGAAGANRLLVVLESNRQRRRGGAGGAGAGAGQPQKPAPHQASHRNEHGKMKRRHGRGGRATPPVGGGRPGSSKGGKPAVKVTAESLDDELDAYMGRREVRQKEQLDDSLATYFATSSAGTAADAAPVSTEAGVEADAELEAAVDDEEAPVDDADNVEADAEADVVNA